MRHRQSNGRVAGGRNAFCYALYLLAKWREPRAYPYVLQWLSLPDEEPFDIAGDVVTQDGGQILAAVCDADLEPIKTLIANRNANEYGRGAAVNALALLAAWAEVPRESVIASFLWLVPELRRAYDDRLIEPQYMNPSELDEVEAARGRMLEKTRTRHPPIDDVVEATAWWGCF